jgi:hypothetical protein
MLLSLDPSGPHRSGDRRPHEKARFSRAGICPRDVGGRRLVNTPAFTQRRLAEMLEAVAAALRLSPDERHTLWYLAANGPALRPASDSVSWIPGWPGHAQRGLAGSSLCGHRSDRASGN